MQRLAVTLTTAGQLNLYLDGQPVYLGSYLPSGAPSLPPRLRSWAACLLAAARLDPPPSLPARDAPADNVNSTLLATAPAGFLAYIGYTPSFAKGQPKGQSAPTFFNGTMADFQFYSYPLAAGTIFQLYNGITTACPSAPPPPVAYSPPRPPALAVPPPPRVVNISSPPPPWFNQLNQYQFAIAQILVSDTGRADMLVNGNSFRVTGAVSDGSLMYLDVLQSYGANTVRVTSISAAPAMFNALASSSATSSLYVIVGVDLPSPITNPNFYRAGQINSQQKPFLNATQAAVRAMRNNPNLLLWYVGNSLNVGLGAAAPDIPPLLWQFVNQVVNIIKTTDSYHPVGTVLGNVDFGTVSLIQQNAPLVDWLGMDIAGSSNCQALPTLVRQAGWNRPYLVTSYGPSDWFQVPVTSWGAYVEQTSSASAQEYLLCTTAFDGDACTVRPSPHQLRFWRAAPRVTTRGPGALARAPRGSLRLARPQHDGAACCR